jgi:Tfp pilus assembly protein PilV
MLEMKKPLQQAGDTIIDVLIAIAVVSFVLGGAYASSRQSLTTTVRSNERAEATKYVEQQLERLRAAYRNNGTVNDVFARTGDFCLDENLVPVTGAACAFGAAGRYAVTINGGVALPSGGKVFTIRTEWDQAGGKGRDNVTMVYRVYPQ